MIMENVAINIINKNTKNINTEDVILIPINFGVIIKPYDENPYRKIETTDSGLIIGIESTKRYKSNETGEYEDNEQLICCGQVIAVGNECKNVKVGDDVYFPKHISTPIPFRKKGYYEISEQNIYCIIKPNHE